MNRAARAVGAGANRRPGLKAAQRDGMRYWSIVPPVLGASGVTVDGGDGFFAK